MQLNGNPRNQRLENLSALLFVLLCRGPPQIARIPSLLDLRSIRVIKRTQGNDVIVLRYGRLFLDAQKPAGRGKTPAGFRGERRAPRVKGLLEES